jgi:hypothetical protein
LQAVTPTAEVMDTAKIYPCKYGKKVGFLRYFESEKMWQCVPCFAALEDGEIEACKKFKGKK